MTSLIPWSDHHHPHYYYLWCFPLCVTIDIVLYLYVLLHKWYCVSIYKVFSPLGSHVGAQFLSISLFCLLILDLTMIAWRLKHVVCNHLVILCYNNIILLRWRPLFCTLKIYGHIYWLLCDYAWNDAVQASVYINTIIINTNKLQNHSTMQSLSNKSHWIKTKLSDLANSLYPFQ